MIVVDTHIFIWYVLGDVKLPIQARDLLGREPKDILLPSVCAWEAVQLAQKGRVVIGEGEPGDVVRRWISRSGFVESPLTTDIAILSRTLPFQHDDPADRFIAATAYSMNAELATSDPRLRNLPWVRLAY